MFINKYTLSSNNITYHHTSAICSCEHSSLSLHSLNIWVLSSVSPLRSFSARNWSPPTPDLSTQARPWYFVQEARNKDHPGIVSPWSQIFSLNMECIVNFARYNEYSGEAQLCHKGCVTKPQPLPPSLPRPFTIINIIFRFVIFGEFNKTLLYNAFLSYFIQSRSR